MIKEKEPNNRIFNEIQKIEERPSENVDNLCQNMQFYPPES